ncbi:PREDICTED: uncharacterized protein PFB0145c isoform X1 [Nicrophorus vespilloides]|uniref:Uncharacterized protein PFB0145c isoform X1 n=1 Tax=Nicrophorus vespilloides TaxID=110193 RepID=A0ABM1NGU9_NICVS|nr:PREDICTED: uncharacterized protein PFB0145c isoform X1 [Nicrophorus vespilloides]
MGNVRSEFFQNTSDDIWWQPAREAPRTPEPVRIQREDLINFRRELELKQQKRRELIEEKRKEMMDLREEVQRLQKENEDLKQVRSGCDHVKEIAQLKDENDDLKVEIEKWKIELRNMADVAAKNRELRLSISEMQGEVQRVNSELVAIEQERLEYGNHITALKDVVRVTKNMLEIRENQIEELKNKVKTVEELLASKEMKIMSDGLREEYERQLRNIRNLRVLYEERQRIDKKDKEHLQTQLEETQKLVEEEQNKNKEHLQRIAELEEENSKKYDEINNLQSNLGLSKADCKELQGEIDIINQLFSEILLGFNNSQEINLDKTIKILEENHGLLTKFANEETTSNAAALPKLLLDLIHQIDKENESEDNSQEIKKEGVMHQLNSAEEIVENLPKVWKILIELLSHQNPPSNDLSGDHCYKSIETPTGPKLKLSVSQTFIRLKDLILEKKFLEREMYRLKHLNTHLGGRLQDQEKRLELVSGELGKTWHVVGKMQRQHQQLHTHEKVIRHELQQKRKLLAQLKEDLQDCREKWVLAREKNNSTQEQWKELRKEFAARKNLNDDYNNSGESGYSDKDTSEDERGYETDVEEKPDKHSLEKTEFNERQSDGFQASNYFQEEQQSNGTVQVVAINEEEASEICNEEQDHDETSPKELNSSEASSVINTENLQEETRREDNASEQPKSITVEDFLNTREMKLKRLNQECKEYLQKVTKSTETQENTTKLENLYENYSLNMEEQPSTSDNYLPEINEEQTITDRSLANTTTIKDDASSSQMTNTTCETTNSKDECINTRCENVQSISIPEEHKIESSNMNESPQPNVSSGAIPKSNEATPSTSRTTEEILQRREERLKRLEEQSKQLLQKVTKTTVKSADISQKLDSLHEMYGDPKEEDEPETKPDKET